jgi:hypothetical protein
MSTVPEVVAARDEGLRVLVLSLVTNMVVGVVEQRDTDATRGRSVREELDAEVRQTFLVFCHFCPCGELKAGFVCLFVCLFVGHLGLAYWCCVGTPGDADCVA